MIDSERVRYIAKLAHLRLDEAEVQSLAADMTRILDYVRKLDELDTSDLPHATHAVPLPTFMREDEVRPGLGVERALANAPERLGDGFGVPKIIE